MSHRTSPTEAGELNRRVEEEKGREDGSSVEFGKNIGRSEELDANTTGGSMNNSKNRNQEQGSMENESSRRPGGESGYGSSSSGRSGSSGSTGSSSNMNRDRDRDRDLGESEVSGNRSSNKDSSEGRH